MDFEPRITSDGSGYGAEHGWGCNFSFGYGYDIIDEDTETEKCRMQALHFLIAKADAEIRDLQDELAILQCQRKWADSDKQRDPYEVCCATFIQRIDSLTSSIQSLSGENVLSGHAVDETLEIRRPAERICDIIYALISHGFSLPDEQVMSNKKNLLANLGSPNTDVDLIQQAAGFESSVESEGPMAVTERQPAHTISEESSSDAARYTLRDSKGARDVGRSDIEVTGRAQLDADECTSDQKSGLLAVMLGMTPTPLQASGEGNPTSDALLHGESEECLTGSKVGESGLTSLSAKIEPLIKLEDDSDMGIQHVAIDSLPKMQHHEVENLVEDHMKETENDSQILFSTPITYNRRKFNLGSIIEGQKSQRKTQSVLCGGEPCNPSVILKPLKKIGKRESPSTAKSLVELDILSTVERICPFTESNRDRRLKIDEDIAYATTSGVLGAERENASIQSPEVEVSNTTGESFGAQSSNGRPMFLGSPHLGEAKGLVASSYSVHTHGVANAEDPINDLENLRLKLSEDPEFLKNLKVSELKAIMKQYKLRGSYKLRKEKIIEELTKLLCL